MGIVWWAAGVLALSACGPAAQLDTSDVESQVATSLSEQVGGRFAVKCPTAVPAEPQGQFDCTATDRESGEEVTVRVVQGADPGAFTWTVRPEATTSP